jgi:hypothetical protein
LKVWPAEGPQVCVGKRLGVDCKFGLDIAIKIFLSLPEGNNMRNEERKQKKQIRNKINKKQKERENG